MDRSFLPGPGGPSAEVSTKPGQLHNRFPLEVVGPLWEQPLATDERWVEMLDDHVMRITRDGEPAGVLESTVPLQVAAPDGGKQPTDVSLRRTPGGFAPAAAVAPTVIGQRVGDGIEFEDLGLGVTATMSDANALGESVDERAFYPDASPDTDVIVGALPAGAAIFYQLRSPASPDELELDIELPAGTDMRLTPDGAVEVRRDAKRLALIAAPYAIDAQQQVVPSRYDIEGVLVSVGHRDGDYAYPVLLDPLIDTQPFSSGHGTGGWRYSNTWGAHFNSGTDWGWGGGLYSALGWGNYYPYDAGAGWIYDPPRAGAFVYSATFARTRQIIDSAMATVCSTWGIADTTDWRYGTSWNAPAESGAYGTGPRVRCDPFNSQADATGTEFCIAPYCAAPDSYPYTFAVFKQAVWGAGPRAGDNISYVGSATVRLYDNDNPQINGSAPANISTGDESLYLSYEDHGLGLKKVSISSPGNPAWDGNHTTTIPCAGVKWQPCPETAARQPAYANLPPGPQTIRVEMEDAGGRNTTRDFNVNINYYWTSWDYGGENRAVDTPEEIEEVGRLLGMADSLAEANAVWDGLTAADRATMDGNGYSRPDEILLEPDADLDDTDWSSDGTGAVASSTGKCFARGVQENPWRDRKYGRWHMGGWGETYCSENKTPSQLGGTFVRRLRVCVQYWYQPDPYLPGKWRSKKCERSTFPIVSVVHQRVSVYTRCTGYKEWRIRVRMRAYFNGVRWPQGDDHAETVPAYEDCID